MINLTEFIGQKLNKPSFVGIKNKDEEKKLVSNRKYQQSYSSRSIGLSTILDLQNEEQNFGGLNISRIGNRSKNTKKDSIINTVRNAKDELQQMKQKRKYLEQKLNQTLTKQQINNKNLKYRNIESFQYKSQNKSQLSNRENQLQRKINRNLQNQNQSYYTNSQQLSYKNKSQKSIYSSNSFNKSYEKSSFRSSNSQSYQFQLTNRSTLNKNTDQFLNFLKKDINTFKCQKFLQYLKNFKNKWLLKNLNQWIQLNKIIKRQQIKLQRFIFISWKRYVNQQNRKLIMAQMIRKRIQQKRNQLPIKNKQSEGSLKKKQAQTQNQETLKYQQQKLRNLTPQKKDQVRQNIKDISKISLRQISPIKPNRFQFQVPDHQMSYYDQYSCITQRQQHLEEEFIK